MYKYFFISIVLLGACSKGQRDDCLTSLGSVNSVTRMVGSFTEISVSDRIIVTLVQDSIRQGEVVLEAPKNLLDQFVTEVDGSRLILRNENTCNFVRSFDYSLKATVYIRDLVRLDVESIAQVLTADTIEISRLEIFHSALSDIDLTLAGDEVYIQSLNSAQTTFHGVVRIMKGSIEEISNLKAFDLKCEEVLLDSHTPLECEISASRGIYVKIYNKGNIVYSIEPTNYKIVQERLGTGELVLKK